MLEWGQALYLIHSPYHSHCTVGQSQRQRVGWALGWEDLGVHSALWHPSCATLGKVAVFLGLLCGLRQQAFILPALARGLKSRCSQGHAIFADSPGRMFLPPFQLLAAAGNAWFIHSAPNWLPPSSHKLLPCVFLTLCLHLAL